MAPFRIEPLVHEWQAHVRVSLGGIILWTLVIQVGVERGLLWGDCWLLIGDIHEVRNDLSGGLKG